MDSTAEWDDDRGRVEWRGDWFADEVDERRGLCGPARRRGFCASGHRRL
jgi:hypothetical protein